MKNPVLLTENEKRQFVNKISHKKSEILRFMLYYWQIRYSKHSSKNVTYDSLKETYSDRQLIWWAMIIKQHFIRYNGIKPILRKETYNPETHNLTHNRLDYIFDSGGDCYLYKDNQYLPIKLNPADFGQVNTKFNKSQECFD